MNITITTIPHSQQRYDTCGDWQFDEQGNLHIRVSDVGDPKMNFLIARHELDEAILCHFNGVTSKQVDEYDFTHPEAGSDNFSANLDAPYHRFHCDALAAEWVMARLLDVNWEDYSHHLEAVGWPKKEIQ